MKEMDAGIGMGAGGQNFDRTHAHTSDVLNFFSKKHQLGGGDQVNRLRVALKVAGIGKGDKVRR